jgi:hypothetical protein
MVGLFSIKAYSVQYGVPEAIERILSVPELQWAAPNACYDCRVSMYLNNRKIL